MQCYHHVAVIGTGRAGRASLLLLTQETWVDKLTLIDTKPGLAQAIEEEVRHALASTRNEINIASYEDDAAVEGADIVLITSGTPRTADMDSRTDLTAANASIIEEIAHKTVPKNQSAKYVVVMNPVDAMATLLQDITNLDWVISTGTNLESQRFRAELSKQLDVPIYAVGGFVGGEHGEDAVFLWSTVRVNGVSVEKIANENGIDLDKSRIEEKVKGVSRKVIQASGGTRLGPAASFRDILRSIALNEDRVLSVASTYNRLQKKFPVKISRPQLVNEGVSATEVFTLNNSEEEQIKESAMRVYETFKEAKKQ